MRPHSTTPQRRCCPHCRPKGQPPHATTERHSPTCRSTRPPTPALRKAAIPVTVTLTVTRHDRPSRSRVMSSVDGLQMGAADVRVDLRRGDRAVTQELLDGPQIGAVFEHVRSIGVPEHVRRGRVEAGYGGVLGDHATHVRGVQRPPAARQQKGGPPAGGGGGGAPPKRRSWTLRAISRSRSMRCSSSWMRW
jgi:hypothetical protein